MPTEIQLQEARLLKQTQPLEEQLQQVLLVELQIPTELLVEQSMPTATQLQLEARPLTTLRPMEKAVL